MAIAITQLEYPAQWFDELAMKIGQRMEGFELDVIGVKHDVGLMVLPHLSKFRQANYGKKTVKDLADKIGWSTGEIYHCIRFAQEYPNLDEALKRLSPIGDNLTWYKIRQSFGKAKEKKPFEQTELLKEPFKYNVWNLPEQRPQGYGNADFPGNTSPAILAQCLTRYTQPGDLILDAMAGSGTTYDVAIRLQRRAILSDIKKYREDLGGEIYKLADAEKIEGEYDFIFLHLPYLDMYHYTTEDNDLSNMNVKEFETKLQNILANLYQRLKKGKFLVILIGDIRSSGLIDLSALVSHVGQKFFLLWDKVIAATATATGSHYAYQGNIGLSLNRAERYNYHLQVFDTLLIFRRN